MHPSQPLYRYQQYICWNIFYWFKGICFNRQTLTRSIQPSHIITKDLLLISSDTPPRNLSKLLHRYPAMNPLKPFQNIPRYQRFILSVWNRYIITDHWYRGQLVHSHRQIKPRYILKPLYIYGVYIEDSVETKPLYYRDQKYSFETRYRYSYIKVSFKNHYS